MSLKIGLVAEKIGLRENRSLGQILKILLLAAVNIANRDKKFMCLKCAIEIFPS